MSTKQFRMAGANDKFNKTQANLILTDLVRRTAKEVALLWDCSSQTIYKIKNGEYPYNYVLGTAAYINANKKRIHNQEIVLEKIAAGEHKATIASELKMGLGTIYKIFNIWKAMTEEEKKEYLPKEETEIPTVGTNEENPATLNEEEIESLGNIMDEVQEELEEVNETDSNGDPLWDEDEEDKFQHEIMSFDEGNISQQYIQYQKQNFQIWKIFILPGYKEGDYVFLINGELQKVPTEAAEALIVGVLGTPTIIFHAI